MTPLAMTLSAHADEFELIVDPIINSISSIDPTLGADLTAALGDFTTSSGGTLCWRTLAVWTRCRGEQQRGQRGSRHQLGGIGHQLGGVERR